MITSYDGMPEWQAAFRRCFEPMLERTRKRLTGAGAAASGHQLDQVARRLVHASARAIVLELNRAREHGVLRGDSPADRFDHFLRSLAEDGGMEEIFERYPLLHERCERICDRAVQNWDELTTRWAADRSAVVRALFDGVDPGALTAAEQAGDGHCGGRAVQLLTFASGRRLVYKPRSLAVHAHFNELLDWLALRSGIAVRTARLVSRSSYGWAEFIEPEGCPDVAGVTRYYYRQGVILALLHLLDGVDMHFENLIAAGEHPVLVDLETLFHSALPMSTTDPADRVLAESVHRTALLPFSVTGDIGMRDLSGLGGDAGEMPFSQLGWAGEGTDLMRSVRVERTAPVTPNRPRVGDVPAEPRDHASAMVAGFTFAYDVIARYRDELLGADGLLARFATDEIRWVARPTAEYGWLQESSGHPRALRSEAVRDKLFRQLQDSSPTELLQSLIVHELADLEQDDIPYFRSTPASTDLWAADGTRVPEAWPESTAATVERRLRELNDTDRDRQNWVIRATLATRQAEVEHRSPVLSRQHESAGSAHPERLLAAATEVADTLLATALVGPDRTNWIGLEPVDDSYWAVLPLGAGLPSGYCGTALFLAQLAVLTDGDRYRATALEAVRPVHQVLESLADEPEALVAAGTGYHGLGGIAYALARLSRLLDDRELAGWAETAIALIGAVPAAAAVPTYGDGDAGGLVALRAVAQLLPTSAAVEVADQLERRLRLRPGLPDGFLRGGAGVAWALGHTVRSAPAGPGWCVSAPDENADVYLARTASRPRLADLSLCHGELGALDRLATLALDGRPGVAGLLARRAGAVLSSIEQDGARSGTPDGVESPGLLLGLAGIGYGLLRLGFADQVPSVLMLEPTPGGHATRERDAALRSSPVN
ncbi:type 2 lantipeptide synthetase LanM [Kribbella antibiotica]|uniref:Type 2 lantipeptide synthetase LanM n=1 Tax=Kribbella antibiotica TaxID=190195 RepID=A0A4R4ZVW0_9ACTN|nr:type 2 lanthipeptide synthetase LanM family protein [Kribbella antibiotica]TDD62660.1 type 2 lantipeptide synthetase LanM [Kribbella antibiotica]